MNQKKTCICGKTYWSPGADWQHKFCVPVAVGGMVEKVPVKNSSREGRRVLKAEGVSSDATRTAATAKARPAPRPRKPGGDGTAAKPETAPKFDRTAYQREYMREYRKRKKEG